MIIKSVYLNLFSFTDKEVIIWKKDEHMIYQDQIKVKVDDRIHL